MFVSAYLPPDWLILLLPHWLRSFTKGWATAEGVEQRIAMAALAVAFSRNVRGILDNQLVVGSQPHVFRPLQEMLHTTLLFVLQGQPAADRLPG